MSSYKYLQHGTPLGSCRAAEAGVAQKHRVLPNFAPQGALGCLDGAEIQFTVSFGKSVKC